MALITADRIYHHAIENDYILGAFNVFNFDTLISVLDAAQKESSPVIVQVSIGGGKYFGNLKKFVNIIKEYAKDYDTYVMINHDHCTTFEQCRDAIDAGVHSVMIDGSHGTYEENICVTKKVAEYAHDRGVWVEAELGCLPGFEDEIFAESAVFTDPSLVAEFISWSKCDSLAVAVGTSHGGVKSNDYLKIDFDRLKRISEAVPGYPLVLHGAASLPPHLIDEVNKFGGEVEYFRNASETDIARTHEYGVRKANMDVDNFLVYTAQIRKYFLENPSQYNPRQYLKLAREAFCEEVRYKMQYVLNSSKRC
jgi:fructose-bisphosphate aldolase class II